jgi:hypothetical protein
MKSVLRAVLAGGLAVFALSAVTASVASAALPEFKPATKQAFAETSGAFYMESINAKITCSKLETTGEITGASTLAYGKQTPVENAGQGETPLNKTVALAGLQPKTTYHYRIVATNLNDAGELNENDPGEYGGQLEPQVVYGEDKTFTTPATPPVLSGVSVQSVTENGATITGTLEAQGLPTRYELQLGSTQELLQPAGSGETSGTLPLSLPVGSLTPGTVYYYKLLVTNSNGTLEPEGSFTTSPASGGPAPASLPAPIPYQTIAQLDAKETKEDSGIPNPTIAKSLTRSQKLDRALRACKRERGKGRRQHCEKTAHKAYGVKKNARKK